MMKNRLILSLFGLIYFILPLSSFSLYDLSCEAEENPLGIETQTPCFSWKINSIQRGFVQSAYQIAVSDSPDFANGAGNMWNSGKTSSERSVLVPYSGKELKSFAKYYWRSRVWDSSGKVSEWSETQCFTMGVLSPEDWGNALWIALESDKAEDYVVPGLHGLGNAAKVLGGRKVGQYKLPQFRKSFESEKAVKRADAFVAGLGQFELFINGEKAGDHFLDPGWTKYDKEALYVSFDVTDLLNEGDNTIGVMLGNGFYNIPNERYFKLVTSYGAPKMKMLLRIEYADGKVRTVVTDESWKAAESPITYSSIYGGEDYDATLEECGWKSAGFDDSGWKSPLVAGYSGDVVSQRSTPIVIHSEMPPVKIYRNRQGWLYDLGQNMSGTARIRVSSSSSQTITLRPAELLNPDSTVNQSATGSPYYFSYKTKGGEKEQWQPQFSYYGFRYVQIEGAVPSGSDNPSRLPEIVSLTGLHTCNSAPEAGSFECSKPLFNQIYSLIDWAMRSNMASVLTDCPHREKLGWLEQAHLMQYSLQYRYNLLRMYWKIEEDMSSSQRADGCIPTIAPEYVRFENGFEDTPEWGSSFIISPWYIYKWYGDTRMLERYYPSMKRYIDYLGSKAQNGIVAYGLGDWFDIGPGSPGNAQLTDNGVTATSIYYYDVTIMQRIASLLGKTQDADHYRTLSLDIKKAFNNEYVDPSTGKIDRNSQTANAMPLYVGLVDAGSEDGVLQNLVDDIRSRGNALTAGDIGYRYVLRALEEGGRSDVIYDMNSRYDVPGYGWQLAHGATALTESWQAYGFVSNNHFMLGHLMEWLFSGIGGIRQTSESVAYHDIVIDPQVVGDLRSASTSYESPYGKIRCSWKDGDEEFTMEVTIPANTEAELVLPADSVDSVSDFGTPVSKSKGIRVKDVADGRLSLMVGSGVYRLVVKK